MKRRGVSFLEMLAMEMKVRTFLHALVYLVYIARHGQAITPHIMRSTSVQKVLHAFLRLPCWLGQHIRLDMISDIYQMASSCVQAEGYYVARGLSFRCASRVPAYSDRSLSLIRHTIVLFENRLMQACCRVTL